MTNKYKNVFINNYYSLLTSKKHDPIILNKVDNFVDDYYLGEKTIELAEAKYQTLSINGLLNKSKMIQNNIDLLISSDLQNQILASSLSSAQYKIPSLGIYSACAGFVEGIIIASNFIDLKEQKIIITTSSHNLVSEKQFRFPIEYGAVRKMVNSSTASGSVSALVSNKKSNIKVESSTIGNVFQTNHKDSNDMGSAMALPCAEVIHKHLMDTDRTSSYYDLILTGDLGEYGVEIMKRYYSKVYKSELQNVIDSGTILYTDKNIYAGASGPICLPLILFNHILNDKKYKKILIVGTGSLHSVISSNLKVPMPGVAHAVSLEVM